MERFTYEDLDCDYFSVKIKTESISKLGHFFSITNQALGRLNDPRVRNCVAVTMDPIQILVDCPQGQLVDAFRLLNITVFANDNPYVLSRTAGKRVHADTLIRVLVNADQPYVYAYGYGMKEAGGSLLRVLDEVCLEGGSQMNVFDIGRSVHTPLVQLFGVKPDSRLVGCTAVQVFPVFKHCGRGKGGLSFKTPDGLEVKIYQLWTHWVKGAMRGWFEIPLTYRQVETFTRKYSLLLSDLKSVRGRLGGYRIEVTTRAPTLSRAMQRVTLDLFDLKHWEDKNLAVKALPVDYFFQEIDKGFKEANDRNLLSGCRQEKTTPEIRTVFVHMVNLIGQSLPWNFQKQVEDGGFEQPPWCSWPHRRHQPRVEVTALDDPRDMATWLKWRPSMNGGYTLTLAANGAEWGPRWGQNGTLDPDRNMKLFLKGMVDLVRAQRIENWKERFALWTEPRPVPDNFENLFGTDIEVAVELAFDEVLQRRRTDQEIQEDNDRYLDQLRDALRIERTRTSEDPLVPLIEQTTVPTREDSGLQPQPNRLRQSTLSFPRSGSPQQDSEPPQQILNPSTEYVPFRYGYPPWARKNMSLSTLRKVNLAASEGRGGSLRARNMTAEDDIVLLEYVFQTDFHNPRPSVKPSSECFWKVAVERDNLMRRPPGTLKNRWLRVASNGFEQYRHLRLSENLGDVGE